MESDCLFCKLVDGRLSIAGKIYEDEYTLALLDIHPISRGHTLVVPKAHHNNIYDTPPEIFEKVMKTVQMLSSKIKTSVGAEGINIGINNDKAAGQIVDHLHVHIIPRWADDGHGSWHGNPYQDGEIGTIRDIIGEEFK